MAHKLVVYDDIAQICGLAEPICPVQVTSNDGTILIIETGTQQAPSYDLSLNSVDINVENLSFDEATNTITLTETDGTIHQIDLSNLALALEIQDEGQVLTQTTNSINFVGEGVTATNVGGAVTVTIPATQEIFCFSALGLVAGDPVPVTHMGAILIDDVTDPTAPMEYVWSCNGGAYYCPVGCFESFVDIFAYTGSDQLVTVPSRATEARVLIWGAGGGGDAYTGRGGGGGYIDATLSNIVLGTTFVVMVGQAGHRCATNRPPMYGFGGPAGPFADCSSGGGGLSGIFTGDSQINENDNSRAILVAGGGGAGNAASGSSRFGNPGHSPSGSGGMASMQGQNSTASDGHAGGGGGYEGGVRGRMSGPNAFGGTGFVIPAATNVSILSGTVGNITPPNAASSYTTNEGYGGAANAAGNNGLVVIEWS